VQSPKSNNGSSDFGSWTLDFGPVGAYEPRSDLLWALAGIAAVLTSLYANPQDLTLLIFPAWIIGAYATSRAWGKLPSVVWITLLWAGYALAPLALYTSANPTLSVVPGIAVMVLSMLLLAW